MSAAQEAKVIAALRRPPPDDRDSWTTAALAKDLNLPRLTIQAAIDTLRSKHKVTRGAIALHPSMVELKSVEIPAASTPAPLPPAPSPIPDQAAPTAPRPPVDPKASSVRHRLQEAMLEEPEDGFAYLRRCWPDLLNRIVALGRGTGTGPAAMMVAVVEAGLQTQERVA